MSDNLTRYCAIREALFEHFPSRPAGNFARRLLTLAALIGGIVGSRKSNLPAIASKGPSGGSPKGGGRESRVKRFSRWAENDRIDASTYYLPFVRALLEGLPPGPLVLAMDGSLVGRGCQALVISVLYEHQGRCRALPLVWSVVAGGKGHLSEHVHQDLLRRVIPLVPHGRPVVFLGDGEYNGVGLLGLISQQSWKFACRIGKNTALCEDDEWFSLSFLPVTPGDGVELSDVLFTGHGFGPVLVTAQWREGDDGPLYLVSNFDSFHEATGWYKKRFLIETLFSDQKSRGFHLCHSRLSDPMRLSRLMIATCLAYLWIVCLGAEVHHRGWQGIVHRKDRCDLSLFQIGLVWLDHCQSEGLPILVPLTPPLEEALLAVGRGGLPFDGERRARLLGVEETHGAGECFRVVVCSQGSGPLVEPLGHHLFQSRGTPHRGAQVSDPQQVIPDPVTRGVDGPGHEMEFRVEGVHIVPRLGRRQIEGPARERLVEKPRPAAVGTGRLRADPGRERFLSDGPESGHDEAQIEGLMAEREAQMAEQGAVCPVFHRVALFLAALGLSGPASAGDQVTLNEGQNAAHPEQLIEGELSEGGFGIFGIFGIFRQVGCHPETITPVQN